MKLLEITTPPLFEWAKKYVGPNRYTHLGGPDGVFSRKQPHYSSPVGVYGYDLNVALKKSSDNKKFIQHIAKVATHGLEFVYILQSQAKNMLDFGKYSKEQFIEDKTKVYKFFTDKCGPPKHYSNYEDWFKSLWSKDWLAKQKTTPWDKPTNLLDIITSIAGSHRKTRCISNFAVVSNHVFRNVLGYDAVKDAPRQSNISLEDFEPDQIVFLVSSAFKVIATYPKPITKQREQALK